MRAGGKYGTALQAASSMGFLDAVELLLEMGADPNVQGASFVILRMFTDMVSAGGRYGTALQAASGADLPGHLKLVKLLLEKGADPNVQGASCAILSTWTHTFAAGGEYGTALQAASYGGHLEIVQFLLENGADPNIQGANFVLPRMPH
jgi:ankyrin repeat protein